MSPPDFFALTWSLYRLQLSAMEATAAIWWTAGRELWLPRGGVARRSEAGRAHRWPRCSGKRGRIHIKPTTLVVRVNQMENDRLERSVERLLDGQPETLEIVRSALDGFGATTTKDDVLVDLLDILEGP